MMICDIYKSPREDGLYLFVSKKDALERVPGVLLERFGEPMLVMTLALTAEKKLTRAKATHVLACLESQGYYLQMPPRPHMEADSAGMLAIGGRNEKLSR